MRTDSRALSTLVGIAQGDMRGCLNTLQVTRQNMYDLTWINRATVHKEQKPTCYRACDPGSYYGYERSRRIDAFRSK